MSFEVRISPNCGLYLRDPQDSKLGKSIIQHSILLIQDIGFEAFTFKKLAQEINSTEASIYRYFENKHLLLLYLVDWYWEWVTYLIYFHTQNIKDPRERLQIIIRAFVSASKEDNSVDYVNESLLHEIIIAEGTKTYHTKETDAENKKGYFLKYKELVNMVSEVIQEINPAFKYPKTLATNLFEMSNNTIYFAKHLPRLTDIKLDKQKFTAVEHMLLYYVDKLLS